MIPAMKRKQIANAITIWTRMVRGIKIMLAIMAQPKLPSQFGPYPV
jgi:hypothetical protein